MKRILVRSGKDPFDVLTPQATMQRNVIGNNVGNLVFATSAHKLLTTPDTEVVSNRNQVDPAQADRINEEFDAYVIPLANAFRPSFERHLNTLTDLIEKLTIPVTILGVGAQSDLDYDMDALAPLNDSVRRFVSAVLDRSPSIGVRGEFSGAYLNSLGFADVEVIGCPSMFLFGDKLSVDRTSSALADEARIGVYLTKGVPSIGDILSVNHERHPNLRYIPQDIKDLEMLYWGDASLGAGRSESFPSLRSHPMIVDGKVDYYLDPWTWIDGLRDYDFTFGTRIHGNIVSILAGTPSFVVAHDSRTLELSRYFDIPHKTVKELDGDFDAATLYAQADYTKLRTGHTERFDRMTGFLAAHGFQHCFEFPDTAAEFDARMAATPFPAPLTVWDGGDDSHLHHRIGWLKEQQAKTSDRANGLLRRVRELEKTVHGLGDAEKRLKDAEKQLQEMRDYIAAKESGFFAKLSRKLSGNSRRGTRKGG